MSTPTRIARYGAVHAMLTWVITPLRGQSVGLQWTVKTCTSFDYDLGTKYASIGGTQIAPVAMTLAGSEPKWSAELAFMEMQDVRTFIGPGWAGIPCKMDLTWQVPGNSAFTDEIFDACLGDGGTTSKKDDQVMVKITGACSQIWPKGIDPFNES